MTETIRTRVENRIGIITFDRPDVLNAMNRELKREVNETMGAWSKDENVLVMLAHGAGLAFSAGFDMKESGGRNLSTVIDWRLALQESFDFIIQFWDCPKLTIAAVHG